MTKICTDCNKEFEISKFQPYITQCKKCRKGKSVNHGPVICERCGKEFEPSKFASNAKYCPECKSKPKHRRQGCDECHKIPPTYRGHWQCASKTCDKAWWCYGNGVYRTFQRCADGKFWFYKDGELVGKGTNFDFKEIVCGSCTENK